MAWRPCVLLPLRRSIKLREASLGGVSALDLRPGKTAGKPRAPGASRGGKGPNLRLRRIRAHLALIVGSAGFSAMMIGIILNATVMQKEHHPAPLFGAAAPPVRLAAAPPAAAPRDLDPSPVPAPAVLPPLVTAAPPQVAATPSPSVARAAPRTQVQGAAAPHAGKPVDGIARWLAGSSSRPMAAAHASGKPVSTQAKAATIPKTRPAVPVVARSEPSPAAVN